MAHKSVTRRCCNNDRAKVTTRKGVTDSITENLRKDYERAVFWASFALMLTWGSMLLWAAWWW